MATGYEINVSSAGGFIFMGLSLLLTMSVKGFESRLASWRPETAKTY